MTEKDNSKGLLDEKMLYADEVWIRHCQQKSRTDEEAEFIRKRFAGKISCEECAKKFNVSLLDWYRKEVIYLGSDPETIKEFEEDFGVKF